MTKTRSIHRHAVRRQAAQAQELSRQVRTVIVDALVKMGLAGDTGEPLRVERAALATAPAQMAAAQAVDPGERAALVASYERCLHSYRGMAQVTGDDAQIDDVGRAVAFFVGVNLHALHGTDADADVLVLLERQLRGLARVRSNWDAAPIVERQRFFENVAILSVVVSGSLAGAASQGPAAIASVQSVARRYLEQMLGLNPDLLTLGPAGLVARTRTNARVEATPQPA